MSLAHTYAAVFRELVHSGQASAPDLLLSYMRTKGHLALAPQLLRILERENMGYEMPVIAVAREKDTLRHDEEIAQALSALGVSRDATRTVVDEALVGGFSVRTPSRMIDASTRTALIKIYQNAIS